MKKSILFFALMLLGAGAFAQNGALTINNNSSCDVYINLFGYDAASLNTAPCAISTWLIIVPAGTSQSWASVGAFNTLPSPGFASEIFPVPPGYWSSTTTFEWTDAQYQYHCPSSDCSGGCAITDPCAIATCRGMLPSCTGYCGFTGTWSRSLPCPLLMSNITITF